MMMTVAVARKHKETEDVFVVELVDPTGRDLPPFSAGSHIDVEIKPGLLRQYSLCNNPNERARYMLGVLKEAAGRGGSETLCDVAEGERLRISEPRNHFELDPSDSHTVLFAGGIGITPILCMAEQLQQIGRDFDMHYCTRSEQRTAFSEQIRSSLFAPKVSFHYDNGADEQKLQIESVLRKAPENTHVYVCGPPPFIDHVIKAAKAEGFNDTNIHREYFSADSAAYQAGDSAFQVRLAASGRMVSVPADRTIMDVLREHGIDLMCACEQGVCGTCLVRVLDGIPDHRDHFLTDAEREAGNRFTPCCSRSKTPVLVLDI